MKAIIHVDTTGLGHSFATTLLTQHNPNIIVIDDTNDFTEQLISHNLTIEDILQFKQ
jgi:hypothetical protein